MKLRSEKRGSVRQPVNDQMLPAIFVAGLLLLFPGLVPASERKFLGPCICRDERRGKKKKKMNVDDPSFIVCTLIRSMTGGKIYGSFQYKYIQHRGEKRVAGQVMLRT